MADTRPNSRTFVLILILAIAVIGVIYLLNQPDRRSPGEKFGDAIGELGDGIQDAGRQLENRTPAEKLGDAAEEAGDKIQNRTR